MGVLHIETWKFGNNWGVYSFTNTKTKTGKSKHESLLTGRFYLSCDILLLKQGGWVRIRFFGANVLGQTASVTI